MIYFVRIFGSLIIAVGITKGLRKIKFPIRAFTRSTILRKTVSIAAAAMNTRFSMAL